MQKTITGNGKRMTALKSKNEDSDYSGSFSLWYTISKPTPKAGDSMSTIIYSGEMEKIHNLPFHVTDHNETIVFEEDVLNIICENDESLYAEHFLASPHYFMTESTVEGKRAYSLLAFVNECVNIFDYYVQADIEKTRESSPSLKPMSERVFPVVTAVAKIGAKVHFNEMEEGETPSSIFEKEIRNSRN